MICGDRDRSCSPEESIKLWHAIPDSRLCIVPSCAHCVHLEKADIFNGIVADFSPFEPIGEVVDDSRPRAGVDRHGAMGRSALIGFG